MHDASNWQITGIGNAGTRWSPARPGHRNGAPNLANRCLLKFNHSLVQIIHLFVLIPRNNALQPPAALVEALE